VVARLALPLPRLFRVMNAPGAGPFDRVVSPRGEHIEATRLAGSLSSHPSLQSVQPCLPGSSVELITLPFTRSILHSFLQRFKGAGAQPRRGVSGRALDWSIAGPSQRMHKRVAPNDRNQFRLGRIETRGSLLRSQLTPTCCGPK